MALNLHKHLFSCEWNPSIRAICIACKWEEWQRTKHIPLSIIGKTFDQQLTSQDKALLHEMLIGV